MGTIPVDLTIRVKVEADRITPEIEDALDALANVMAVQAEDGLYSAGSPDAAADDNEFVADVAGFEIVSVIAKEES